MQARRLGRLAALAAAVVLVVPALAEAGNEVTKWNEIAVGAVVGSPPTFPTPPPLLSAPPASAVFVAMVQGAVYGAVNAADRHGRPYLIERSFPKASADAAAATAAYRVLSALYPGQQAAFDAAYAESLAAISDQGEGQGRAVGEMAAAAMLADGHSSAIPIGCMFGAGAVGEWQPLAGPTGGPVCDPTVWVANSKPFLLESPWQFRTAGPYSVGSPEYTADYEEVKSLGSIDSTTRTPGETHAAAFWQTGPAANYNGLARRFVDRFGLDVSDSARLFALVDLSAADAIINTWNDKYHYNFWRPITAIRRVDDGNPATVSDPTWTPLFSAGFATSPPLPASPLPAGGVGGPLSTPPYPEHPSGATAYASASMHAFASFFGTDEMSDSFYLTSGRFPGEQRAFTRFSDVTKEVVGARIWAGIHFRNADEQAAQLGGDIERYVHKHWFAAAH